MKKIIALGVVVFGLVAAYTIAWFWAAGQASTYVKTLESADGVSQPRLVCGSFGIGGYPFGFDVTCADATIESGDIKVTVGGIKATAKVYRPTHVLMTALSPVGIDDAFTGSRSRLDFAAAQASMRLDGWRLGRASLVLNEPMWNDTVLEDRLVASASKVEAHLVDVPGQYDAAAGLATLAQYVVVEGLDAPGFEIGSGESTFEAQITRLPDDVRTYGDADLLRRWQDAGGKYTIAGFKGGDATSSFDASGTLGLDGSGRIEGQLKLHSMGVVERLGPLFPEQYRGWIVGTQAEDGSYSQTLNIAAGVVFSGLMPTGIIPPLF
jgi:hypothetical protein